MSKALLSAYADTRKYTVLHEGGMMETRQDAEPILEFVKMRAELGRRDPEFYPLGEIPLATFGEALRDGWAEDDKAWRRWFAENPKFTDEYYR